MKKEFEFLKPKEGKKCEIKFIDPPGNQWIPVDYRGTVMKRYFFYWFDGKVSINSGISPEDAFTRMGYGAGAIRALDFYEQSETQNYTWDKEKHDWIKK